MNPIHWLWTVLARRRARRLIAEWHRTREVNDAALMQMDARLQGLMDEFDRAKKQ